ncbi:6-phosphogluconate dehydrogenase (decarboxylating) [Streptococcus sp. 'caviae']|nr:6-phosphogluconate dehydrogenase (decarboxylating) [Streptococcus sp. 'caviae']
MKTIGIIGLGKMGFNLALNAQDHDWSVVGFDEEPQVREKAEGAGIQTADSLDCLIESLESRKIILLSTPAGAITNHLIGELKESLQAGDIVIDSGNSNFKDSLKNYQSLKEKDIGFLDCGTSGGVFGARNGACLMIGGEQGVFDDIADFFEAISIEGGCLFIPEPAAGHYLKMVHNGIEYGMMQAIGEGFSVLEASAFSYDYAKVANVWNHGSVIRSWLVEIAEEEFRNDSKLGRIEGVIDANGEAQWTVEEALQLEVPVPVIANSLFVRNSSKLTDSFSNKVVAALRHGFGGHAVKLKK